MIKVSVFTLTAMLFMIQTATAIETGVILQNDSLLKFNKNSASAATIEQKETLVSSFKVPLSEDGTSYFVCEGSVQHKLTGNISDGNDFDSSAIIDCTLFKLQTMRDYGSGKKVYISMGRYMNSDITGNIFMQPADGASVIIQAPRFDLSFSSLYTGFQNYKNVSIVESSGSVYFIPDERKVYEFAAPYWAGQFSVNVPYITDKLSLAFETCGFAVASGIDGMNDTRGRFYATAVASGSITPIVFYSFSGTTSVVEGHTPGLLLKGDVNCFTEYKNASFAFSALYASGNHGDMSPFVGFTKNTLCASADEPLLSGAIKMGISASILPTDIFFCSLGIDEVFLSPDSSVNYHGTQVSALVRCQLFTDLSLSLTGSCFIGKNADKSKSQIGFNASFAL